MKSVTIILCAVLALLGCASQPSQSTDAFLTRLYRGSYDDVWVATLKAVNDYPLKLSNKDSGKIFSEVVNGPYNELFFSHPEPVPLPERFRFTIKLNFGRLETESGQSLVRLRVIKELEKFQDFYTGWVLYPSDGLEEKLLLYRIEHILAMDRIMNAAPPSPAP